MPKAISGFSVVIPITYNGCPQNNTFSTCALRKYLAKNKTVFAISLEDDSLYLPQSSQNSWEEIRSDIEQMYEICTTCQMKNVQKTK